MLLLGTWLASAGETLAADRTAGEILREINAVKVPPIDAQDPETKLTSRNTQSKRQAQIVKESRPDPRVVQRRAGSSEDPRPHGRALGQHVGCRR